MTARCASGFGQDAHDGAQRIHGVLTQWGLKVPTTRLRQPDGLALLEARGVPEVWRRSVAEALAVIDWLDERLAPLERELRPLARCDARVALLDELVPARLTSYQSAARRERAQQRCGRRGMDPSSNRSSPASAGAARSSGELRPLRAASTRTNEIPPSPSRL